MFFVSAFSFQPSPFVSPQPQIAFDVPGQVFVNLGVAGHGLSAPVGRVPVNVVP
jgi:hypothetical protein